jgi:hypothetical protein
MCRRLIGFSGCIVSARNVYKYVYSAIVYLNVCLYVYICFCVFCVGILWCEYGIHIDSISLKHHHLHSEPGMETVFPVYSHPEHTLIDNTHSFCHSSCSAYTVYTKACTILYIKYCHLIYVTQKYDL